ncbi:metallopeptidase family protein [Altererythrobacter sp. GH1-8]|uniref:metallopeptidase family protein n=1 Tax=Altererythrobacter sp. GH1-8 TaxID=3349333 RepID=UPI00374D9F9B
MTQIAKSSEKLVQTRTDHHVRTRMLRASPPTPTTFEQLSRETIARMPAPFRNQLDSVVIKVEEFASSEQLAAVGLSDKWQLSGLYEGRPLTEQSVWESGSMPAVISLFMQPLLAEMRDTGVPLEELIQHVVVHEAGHHFGFSDEEMHALEESVRD